MNNPQPSTSKFIIENYDQIDTNKPILVKDDPQPSTSKFIIENIEQVKTNNSETDDEIEDNGQTGTFKCYLCSLEEIYQYKGKKPPFARYITLKENCYMMEDPFSPPKSGEFFILGTECSICHKDICKANTCSFFYCQTYCLKCLKLHYDKFPTDIQAKVNKILKL